MDCPCHSHKPYEECCSPYHLGENPPTALALMRSRYSAYALGKTDYIIATTHPDNSTLSLADRKKQIESFFQNTQFDGLEILEWKETPPTATVTFKAILSQKGHNTTFTEKSDFEQVNGRWLYRKAISLS